MPSQITIYIKRLFVLLYCPASCKPLRHNIFVSSVRIYKHWVPRLGGQSTFGGRILVTLGLALEAKDSFTMAANSYYNHPSSQPDPEHDQGYAQQSYSTPPPYSSRPRAQTPSPVSPFEAPFDDNVYPMRPNDSMQSFGRDSTYYGQGEGGRPQPSINSFSDDIPLRDYTPKQNMETDHVYDARESGIPSGLGNGRDSPRGRFGHFRAPRGKIAWVVWCLTTIQVAVFIAELVKNGESMRSVSASLTYTI